LLLEADPAASEAWTQRCARLADTVVLVAAAESAPSAMVPPPSPLRRRRELVLVHRDATVLPSGTRRWLELVEPDAHHHVRLGVRSLVDYPLPIVAAMRGRRLDRLLEEVFGDTRVEDLWRSYFCVSSNLVRAEPVVHERGLLRRAIRASSALAGLFPPVVEDG